MTLNERIQTLSSLFQELENTPGRLDKEYLIQSTVTEELKEDFDYCIEILSGQHKIGYNYGNVVKDSGDTDYLNEAWTIKEVIETFLMRPLKQHDLSITNCEYWASKTDYYYDFFVRLYDQYFKFKLGIGRSLLETSVVSPMLAKKFDPDKLRYSNATVYITEKLDGNRCIARFDTNENKWKFTSRNGKPMNVEFDCSTLDKRYVYDGEILSPIQVEMSNEIVRAVRDSHDTITSYVSSFNSTSGLINRKSAGKDLIYNVFDIVNYGENYSSRRTALQMTDDSSNVRILPYLGKLKLGTDMIKRIFDVLDIVTSIGGEGLMINLANAMYEQKRTDSLLKLKKVKTIDMKVQGVYRGTGKYEFSAGGLGCSITTNDGKRIVCNVGSGLSDEQRDTWYKDPNLIIGSIVEIEYFDLSQTKELKGTNEYSLRFPRLKRVRTDKKTTSEY